MLDITPLLRAFGARRRAELGRLDAAAVQERTLVRLVRRAADTRFGPHGWLEVGREKGPAVRFEYSRDGAAADRARRWGMLSTAVLRARSSDAALACVERALTEDPEDHPAWGVRSFSVDDPDGFHLTIARKL